MPRHWPVDVPQTKVCESCGSTFDRWRSGGRADGSAQFRARRFCSHSCSDAAHVGMWYRDDPPWLVADRGHDTPCWVWQRHADARGYGYLTREGRRQAAYRWAYETMVGPVPDGCELDHLCRVRECVNPAHMEPVTHAENTRRGARAKLTHETAALIRERFASGAIGREIAAEFNVGLSTVYAVRNGRTWRRA